MNDESLCLVSAAQISACIRPAAGSVIEEGEKAGHVLLVQSGRANAPKVTLVTHVLIAGGVDPMADPRRVQVISVEKINADVKIHEAATMITRKAEMLPYCVIAVDATGTEEAMAEMMEAMTSNRVYRVRWGRAINGERAKQFASERAQACVDTACAVSQNRITLPLMGNLDIVIQGSRMAYQQDENGVYSMLPRFDREEGEASAWDTICFAFLDGLPFVPSEPMRPRWSSEDITQFDQIIGNMGSDAAPLRDAAKKQMAVFVDKHGFFKCDAMQSHLNRGLGKGPGPMVSADVIETDKLARQVQMTAAAEADTDVEPHDSGKFGGFGVKGAIRRVSKGRTKKAGRK